MDPISVPAPPKSAFNKQRLMSDLIKWQVRHFKHLEQKLPPEHREALKNLGPSVLHRKSFAPVLQADLPWEDFVVEEGPEPEVEDEDLIAGPEEMQVHSTRG